MGGGEHNQWMNQWAAALVHIQHFLPRLLLFYDGGHPREFAELWFVIAIGYSESNALVVTMAATGLPRNGFDERFVRFQCAASIEQAFAWMQRLVGIVFFAKAHIQNAFTIGDDRSVCTQVVWHTFATVDGTRLKILNRVVIASVCASHPVSPFHLHFPRLVRGSLVAGRLDYLAHMCPVHEMVVLLALKVSVESMDSVDSHLPVPL